MNIVAERLEWRHINDAGLILELPFQSIPKQLVKRSEKGS